MAALQSIRNRGVLLVAAIAVALFLFVIGDALRGGESIWNQSKMNVGQINGEKVTIQEYQDMTREYQNFYEVMSQKSNFTEQENNQINDEAWNMFIQNKLIADECCKLGIEVTDEEVAEVIQSGQTQYLQTPFFQNQQGRYDYANVQAFLDAYNKAKEAGQLSDDYTKIYNYYIFAQKAIRNQLLAQKYQVLFASCFLSNKLEAKVAHEERTKEIDALVAAVPFSSVDDKDVEVSDEEIKAKYEAEKEKFAMPQETRDIKFIDVIVVPSAEDKAAAEKEMDENYGKLLEAQNNTAAGNVVRQASSLLPYTNILKKKDSYPAFIASALDSIAVGTTLRAAYDASQNVYYTAKLLDKAVRPDSVLFRQIVVAEDEKAAKKIDSIMTALNSGANFKELAKKLGQNGDSTWLTSNQYEGAQLDADNALFVTTLSEMSAGQTKPIKVEGGTIILQVMQTKNPVTKYNVAAIVKELIFSDETYKNEYNKFSSFIAANPTMEQIDENAAKNGYALQPIENLNSASHNIYNIRGTHDALRWVFEDAKVGEVSQIYECGNNNHLLVAILTGVNEAGYYSIDKVKEYITNQLLPEKKAEKIIASLASVNTWEKAQAAKGAVCDTIRHITFSTPTFVKGNGASESIVSALAYKTDKGAFAGPVKGVSGVYMLKVLNSIRSAEKMDEKQEMQTAAQQNSRSALYGVMQTLTKNANIKDTRYKFF